MIWFSLILELLYIELFPFTEGNPGKKKPNLKIRICIYVGTHRYYVKPIWKRIKDTEKRLSKMSKSYMFRHSESFQITKVNITHKSCLPSKLLCNNTGSSMQFLNLSYGSSRKILTATLMSFLPKRRYRTDKPSRIASWFAYPGVPRRKIEIKTL